MQGNTTLITVSSAGVLTANGLTMRCALGKNGLTNDKCEGDMKTPIGCFPLRELYVRRDRVTKDIDSPFPVTEITRDMGWCDAPQDPAYNTRVALPHSTSHEILWREDYRYDIIITLGYNDNPAVAGKGSAIFFHIAEDDYRGTQGCIAISQRDMLTLLPMLSQHTYVDIAP